jgi:hypothetical protein
MRDESEHEVDAEGAGDVLWRILYGAIATRAAGIVAGLGVADALASGPRPVAEVAAEVGADADTSRRGTSHTAPSGSIC